jgi:putative ABC transport system permease protein
MARTFWPDEEPLGRHVRLSRSAAPWTTVVGIVANARVESLTDASVPEVYTSIYQKSPTFSPKHLAIFLRGYLDGASIPDALRDQIEAVDSTLPVFGAHTLDETVSASLSERRFATEMMALFALTALLLAGLSAPMG